MKRIKRTIASLAFVSSILAFGAFTASAEEITTASNEEQILQKQQQHDAELDPKVNNIYSKHAREIGQMKKEAIDKANVKSVKELNPNAQKGLEIAEKQIEEKMKKAIDNEMRKNGWEKVEDTQPEEEQITTNSYSGNVKLTRSLYKNSSGYYTYYGYWNWTDGTWDSYADIEDLLSIRSSKDITLRSSAYIYSYDNYGYSRNDRVARRTWEADGAVFNVHDYLGYGYGGSMPMYYTDNGYAKFTFKAPTGSEIYTHFVHNYKAYSWTSNAIIDFINLSNTSFTVAYDRKNYSWTTVSNPLITN